MKYLSFGLLLIFSCMVCKAQTTGALNIYKIDKMLKGQWVSKDDTSFTVTIHGDTIVEKRPSERRRFTFTIDKETCDPDADTKLARKYKTVTPTGFYLNESSMAFDGVEYCDILVSISDSTMTWFSTNKLMDLTRKK